METKKITVSSRNGNGATAGAIIIRCKGSTKEVKAVMFSCSEAEILISYIDKLKY